MTGMRASGSEPGKFDLDYSHIFCILYLNTEGKSWNASGPKILQAETLNFTPLFIKSALVTFKRTKRLFFTTGKTVYGRKHLNFTAGKSPDARIGEIFTTGKTPYARKRRFLLPAKRIMTVKSQFSLPSAVDFTRKSPKFAPHK
jgi:hypothetical protein